ncbi:MAG: hypothetical protein ABIL39_11555, partial [candidate division WOR-3 bacterium]
MSILRPLDNYPRKIKERAERIEKNLIQALNKTLNQAVKISVSEYLSGPRPQKLKSETMRSRFAIIPAQKVGNIIKGLVGISYKKGNINIAELWELTGHGAYEVTPKRAKAIIIPVARLIRYSPSAGRTLYRRVPEHRARMGYGGLFERGLYGYIFRKRAMIPAVPPKPFLRPVLEKAVMK